MNHRPEYDSEHCKIPLAHLRAKAFVNHNACRRCPCYSLVFPFTQQFKLLRQCNSAEHILPSTADTVTPLSSAAVVLPARNTVHAAFSVIVPYNHVGMCSSSADLAIVDFGLTYELADILTSHLVFAPQQLCLSAQKQACKITLVAKPSEVRRPIAALKEFQAPPLHTLVTGETGWASKMRHVQNSIKPRVRSPLQ